MADWLALRFDFQAMASPCALLLDGTDEAGLRAAAQAAIDEVRRIEAKYSRYQEDSWLGRLNAACGPIWHEMDEESAGLIAFADQLWQASDGAFDITAGVLNRAWDFRGATPPTAQALAAVRAHVGWQRVEREAARIRLPVGMALDLGGIGKEYAADRATAVLLAHGVAHALVNLGGDVHAVGPRGLPEASGQPWQIDIAHPRPRPGSEAVLASLPLARGGLATSGDYERGFTHAGRRYGHILDARTGWPASHWQAATVLAPTTSAAGALATLALLRQDDAPAWLRAQAARFILVRHDGAVFTESAHVQTVPETCP